MGVGVSTAGGGVTSSLLPPGEGSLLGWTTGASVGCCCSELGKTALRATAASPAITTPVKINRPRGTTRFAAGITAARRDGAATGL